MRKTTTNVGSVALKLKLSNKSAFQNDVVKQGKTAASQLSGTFAPALKKIGALAAAAFSIKAITAFSKECIELGSDLTEVQNVVDVTFGKSSEKINSWAKTTSTAFGISELSAKQYSGTMGAMLKSMGIASDKALDMSMNITSLAGDMASFYNLDTDTAFEKIRSGISGETEPLKQLGINMSVANLEAYALSQGISTAYSKMSQASQAVLRYNYLLSVTSDAQGDFSRTSDSWANQVRILQLNFDSLKSSIGQLLINALTPLLKNLNILISYANNAASALAKLFGSRDQSNASTAMSGVSSSAVQAAKDLTSTEKTAKKAAKKINSAFADIDEIHILGNQDSSDANTDSTSISPTTGASGTGNMAAVDTAMTGTEKKLDRIKEKIAGLWNGFSSKFQNELNVIKSAAEKLKAQFKKMWKDIESLGSPLKNWFKNDYMKYLQTLCSTFLNVVGGIADTLSMVFSDLWNIGIFPILQKFTETLLPVLTQVMTNLVEVFNTSFGAVKEIFDTVWAGTMPQALETVAKIFSDVCDIISEKWQTYGQPIFDEIEETIENVKEIALNAWNGLIKPCWDEVMEYVDELWDEHLKPLTDNVSEFVGEFVQGALEIYNKFIAPLVKWIQEKVYPVFVFAFKSILNVVKPVINFVVDSFNNIVTCLKGVVKFITGVFTGNWKKAWEGVKDIFSGVWNQLKNIIKLPINIIMAGLENVANGAVKVINKAIGAINSVKEHLGGKSSPIKTISEVTLPRLANGGYLAANNPRLAIVGDNKREGEIVSPESKIREQVELALRNSGGNMSGDGLKQIIKQAVYEVLTAFEFAFGGDWHIVLVDERGNVTSEQIISAVQRKNQRDGKTVIRIGV